MFVIKVNDRYYVSMVMVGFEDTHTGDVAVSEDIDDAVVFDGIEGLFLMHFIKACDSESKFEYKQVEYNHFRYREVGCNDGD